MALPPFSAELNARIAAAVRWLECLVDRASGDAPNLGANDGANLLPLTDAPYRDYRPAVQLAAALFRNERFVAGDGVWMHHLGALGVPVPAAVAPAPASSAFAAGGLTVLHRDRSMALLRVPRHRFRPGHADPLHVDLWVHGENCLRDDGTFSYNADPASMEYFGGVGAHNTIEFDDMEPMPRLGRFLWGDWLQANESSGPVELPDRVSARARYTTASGAVHERTIALHDDRLVVTDRVRDFERHAVCRWRLRPGAWVLNGTRLADGRHELSVECDAPIARVALVEGWESRHYQQRTVVPVLEVELATPTTLRTTYRWTP